MSSQSHRILMPPPPLVALAGWFVPGAGYVMIGQRARGVVGIGEPPTVSTASAIANAVRNATGATIRSLPLHPHRILQAIEEQKAGGTL